MFYWGTLLGAAIGFYLEEIPGGIFGIILGFLVDKSIHALQQPGFTKINPAQLAQLQREFFLTTFAVMGHIASTMGNEDPEENEALNKVIARLNLPLDVHEEATELYNEGKSRNFDLKRAILSFYNACHSQVHLLEMFLEIQLLAAYRDGEIQSQKNQVLLTIAKMLQLSRADYDRILSTIRAEDHFARENLSGFVNSSGSDEDAYAILYLSPNATNEEIKKAYRRLTSMHHPDKLVAKGLPEEMLKIAENKTREIRIAYERIRAIRNF